MQTQPDYIFGDMFSIKVPRQIKRKKVYTVTFDCGSTWEFSRDDLDVAQYEKGEQTGMTFCFDTVKEAIETLEAYGYSVSFTKWVQV